MATSKKDAVKAPQDHKPPTEIPAGTKLLKPAATLMSHERLEIMADLTDALIGLGFDMEAGEGPEELSLSSGDQVRALASLHRAVYRAVADGRDGDYRAIATGEGAEERVTDLAIWYFGQLGE